MRRSGVEVRTPVWFASKGSGKLYCFSAADAGKVKRINHTKQVKVAACDVRGGSCGEWFNASAFLITEAEESREAYSLLKKKYGLQMAITNFFSKLTGKINNRAVIRIDLGEYQ